MHIVSVQRLSAIRCSWYLRDVVLRHRPRELKPFKDGILVRTFFICSPARLRRHGRSRASVSYPSQIHQAFRECRFAGFLDVGGMRCRRYAFRPRSVGHIEKETHPHSVSNPMFSSLVGSKFLEGVCASVSVDGIFTLVWRPYPSAAKWDYETHGKAKSVSS
jgi:hypothetical protein